MGGHDREEEGGSAQQQARHSQMLQGCVRYEVAGNLQYILYSRSSSSDD